MFFDFFLVLVVCYILPRTLWKKKKIPTLKECFGFNPPKSSYGGKGTRIWIHAVSVGEVKAAQPLVTRLIEQEKECQLLITTTTLSGREEALRSMPHSAQIRIHPLDFSWIMRRWIRYFCPQYLLFVEGDLWPNLLREAKQMHVKTALVSGRISQRSARCFSLFPFLSRILFNRLDLIAVQNEEQKKRFSSFTQVPIHVLGNLKLEILPREIDREEVRKRFAFFLDQPVITISCTHNPEEKELLQALQGLWKEFPNLVFFLAPRHPERFEEVASFLETLGVSFCRWREQRVDHSVVLVDTMGELPVCYAISKLSIVAGSFSSRVGGHNLLEPCSYGCPVLFGPHIFAQKELAQLVTDSGAGKEVSLTELPSVVRKELIAPSLFGKRPAHMRPSERIVQLLKS